MAQEPISGIYKIVHRESGTTYVGSSQDVRRRWVTHRRELRTGQHNNGYLQCAWDKYGSKAFRFSIVEEVEIERLLKREQYWLDQLAADGTRLYNIAIDALAPMRGRRHSAESRRKLRKSLLVAKAKPYPAFVKRETGERIVSGVNLTVLGKEYGLDRCQMRKVADGTRYSHKGWYLADADWDTLDRKKSAGKAANGARPYPALRNVRTGEIIPAGRNVSKLCREHDLAGWAISNMLRGIQRSHKGWVIADSDLTEDDVHVPIDGAMGLAGTYPSFYNERTGESISAGVNLNKLCRERDLDDGGMGKVKNGDWRSYKGWVLKEVVDEDLADRLPGQLHLWLKGELGTAGA